MERWYIYIQLSTINFPLISRREEEEEEENCATTFDFWLDSGGNIKAARPACCVSVNKTRSPWNLDPAIKSRSLPPPLLGAPSSLSRSWVTMIAWNAAVARDAIAPLCIRVSSCGHTWIGRVTHARTHVSFFTRAGATHTAATWWPTRTRVRAVRPSFGHDAQTCVPTCACPRVHTWMRYVRARVHLRHVYPSRFGLGGYIGESRPENWLGTMDRENFTKGEGGVVGVHAVDGMETGAWMCAFRRRGHWSSALFRLVPLQHCAHVRSRFSGIVCNQRTDASEQRPLSLSLPLFFHVFPLFLLSFFFFFTGEIVVVFTRVENTWYRGRALNFYPGKLYSICRCALSLLSEMLATRLEKSNFE